MTLFDAHRFNQKQIQKPDKRIENSDEIYLNNFISICTSILNSI